MSIFLSTHFFAVKNVRYSNNHNFVSYSLPSNTLQNLTIYFLPPYSFPSPCSRYNGTCQSCIGSLRKLNLNFRMAGLRQIILTKNKFSLAIQPVPTTVEHGSSVQHKINILGVTTAYSLSFPNF